MFVFCDMSVTLVAPDGKDTQVGVGNGIAVYTPNALRKFRIQLNRQAGANLNTGKLLSTYNAQSDVRPQTFASSHLELP